MKTLVLIALFCGFIYTVQGGVPVGLYIIKIHGDEILLLKTHISISVWP